MGTLRIDIAYSSLAPELVLGADRAADAPAAHDMRAGASATTHRVARC
jgi:hypothetical protein